LPIRLTGCRSAADYEATAGRRVGYQVKPLLPLLDLAAARSLFAQRGYHGTVVEEASFGRPHELPLYGLKVERCAP
jgi:hypothetical protein